MADYLVVGGCGFLGWYIVEEILNTKPNARIRVFDIRLNPLKDDPRIELMQGDICKMSDVLKACTGITHVIHTASPPHGRGYEMYYRVNVIGTENLLKACLETNVSTFVFTSSASVVFDGTNLKGVDESTPLCTKFIDPYIETKVISEKVVLEANGKPTPSGKPLLTCSLRPSGIFGPRDVQAWPGFIEAAQAGKSKYVLGNGENKMDWTYVENVALSHIIAADRLLEAPELVAGEAFFITNDEPMLFWDMPRYIWKNLGYPLPTIFVPLWLIWYLSILIDLVVKVLAPIVTLHPTITFFRVVNASSDRYFSIEKAKKRLGYTPRVSLQEGLERTLEAFKSHKNTK